MHTRSTGLALVAALSAITACGDRAAQGPATQAGDQAPVTQRAGAGAAGAAPPSASIKEAAPPLPDAEQAPAGAGAAGAAAGSAPSSRPEVDPRAAHVAHDEAYAGTGFVVHEWGTNTIVVGSDGSLQRGLQHEGDDLPGFVFDRLKQGDLLGFPALDKMETPVIYFYSDAARSVKARVNMPRGVLTQWYPAVAAFAPPILNASRGLISIIDPVSATDYPYASQQCIDKYTAAPAAGVLDWGQVEILAPDAASPALPEAPLDRYTWSYARQVAANVVRVQNPMARSGGVATGEVMRDAQAERFLFYRGLGRFEPPLRVVALAGEGGETIRAEVLESTPGPVWLLNVNAQTGAYRRLSLEPGQRAIEGELPRLDGAAPLERFVDQLAAELTQALLVQGLYRDEALAMVNTWRRQWFASPGVRVLYFAPASWFERELPLEIAPAPDRTVRVMVMRVELLTHADEAVDLARALDLGSTDEAAQAEGHFRAHGRFAEPRLRRALSLLGARAPEAAQRFLAEVAGPNVMAALGE